MAAFIYTQLRIRQMSGDRLAVCHRRKPVEPARSNEGRARNARQTVADIMILAGFQLKSLSFESACRSRRQGALLSFGD